MEQRRLAAAVGAHERSDLARAQLEVEAAEDPCEPAPVAKPGIMHANDDRAVPVQARRTASGLDAGARFAVRRNEPARLVRSVNGIIGGWAARLPANIEPPGPRDPRHGDLAEAPLDEPHRLCGIARHGGGPVCGHNDGHAKLAIGPKQQGEQGVLGHRVEHARGLVEQQEARAHRERCGKCDGLPLAARELGDLPAKEWLDAQEVAGLGHTPAHRRLGHTQVLEAKRQLVPHGVADQLSVRVLEHEAHGPGGVGGTKKRRVRAKEPDGARALPRRRQLGLAEAQEGRLSRARSSREQGKGASGNLERHVGQDGRGGAWVGKREALDAQRRSSRIAPHTCPRISSRANVAHASLLSRQRASSSAPQGRSSSAAIGRYPHHASRRGIVG